MGIITISRGSYSRGKEIAEKLAQRLGYDCISREILLDASKDFNVPEVKLMQAIQDAPSFLDRLKHGKKKYISFIHKAFLETVQKDNVIYHGLAGHFFTQGIPNVLKIRITANINERINIVMQRENVDEANALQLLNKIDAQRNKWSMFLYGIDTTSSELYDIVLHIDCIKTDGAVEILYKLAKYNCFQTNEQTIRKLNDRLLEAKSYAVIVDKFPDANVKSKDGVVLVTVESSLKIEKKISSTIKELLSEVNGIKEVKTFVIPFET